jgi:RNA polymerase sigma-70 factor (ECF subfamily)
MIGPNMNAGSSALVRIYEGEHGRLKRLLRRMTGSAEAAEDIVHDAVLKLHGRDMSGNDVGLLVRTAQNLARDAMRAEKVRSAYAGSVMAEQLSSGPIAPDEVIAGQQELNDLLTALKTLPERTRRIFLMSKVDEMTYPEIARTLRVSVSTVEKEMVSALEFCRAWRRRRE